MISDTLGTVYLNFCKQSFQQCNKADGKSTKAFAVLIKPDKTCYPLSRDISDTPYNFKPINDTSLLLTYNNTGYGVEADKYGVYTLQMRLRCETE